MSFAAGSGACISAEPTRIASAPGELGCRALGARVDAGLGDDDPVARRRARRARAAPRGRSGTSTRSRALIPITGASESDRAVELLGVVRLDEGVEPELGCGCA